MHSSQPNVTPSSSIQSQITTGPSLLDVSTTEIAQIAASKLIGGFSILSGATNFVADKIANVSTVVQASAFGALGLAGSIAGSVQAYKEISTEQTKVIKLNKELFLMFNLAADKLAALKNAEKKFRIDDNQKYHLIKEEYHECITQIHSTLSSPAAIIREIEIDKKLEGFAAAKSDEKSAPRTIHHSTEHNRIHGIICEYAEHRKTSSEYILWETLKNNNVYALDAQLANFFVEFNNDEEVKNYFREQRENEREEYKITMHEYRHILQNLDVEHLKERESLNELNRLRTDMSILLDHIHDNGDFQDNQRAINHLHIKFKQLKFLHDNIIQLLNEDTQNALQKPASTLIDTMNMVTCNAFNKRVLLSQGIVESSDDVFGEQGSFRTFWRALPTKKYSPRQGEEIPLNFEQSIYRGGKSQKYTGHAVMGFGVTVGLFYTGKGLYASALALGAVGIGSMGVGLLVGALALGLALMCVYFYHRSNKIQNDRDELYTRLNRGRACLFVNEQNSKALTDIIARPANDKTVCYPSLGGMFSRQPSVPVNRDHSVPEKQPERKIASFSPVS